MARERMTIPCPECGHEQETDQIHDGEVKRVTNCPACGDWFTVYDE